MFDNPEIKGLRQDIDLISEQISKLVEMLDSRHAEIMTRLDVMEEKLDVGFSEEVSQSDIEDIKATVEQTNEEITELTETVQNLDAQISKPA